MINILIPLAGSNNFFSETEYLYPKPLIELNGKVMIQHVIDNLNTLSFDKQFIFIVNNTDCKRYHLDNVLNLLTDNSCKIIKLNAETKGAACSSLLAIQHIYNDNPLIIANADQILDICFDDAINHFENTDAGVIIFESFHPRWSYIRLDEDSNIIETAEKKPISKNAIAGFYYFKKGKYFCKSAMKMIKKDSNVDGLYFIAPSLNEMILDNKKLIAFEVDHDAYHSFYSPNSIKEYERTLKC